MRVPRRQQNPSLNGTGQQNSNGACGPGLGGQAGGGGPISSSQMHHDVVYGPTRGDMHCGSTNQ